jgi:hypothetical protein
VLPLAVAADDHGAAVRERNLELRQKFRLFGVLLARAPSDASHCPAVAEQCADDVFAAIQQTRDVVGVVLDAFGVIGPARSEYIFADGAAVDRAFIHTESGDVQAC